MTKKKLLERVENSQRNVRYDDFIALVRAFGFRLIRIRGSHRIYERSDIPEMVNTQEIRGQAKQYQVKQFLGLVEKYSLRLEDRHE